MPPSRASLKRTADEASSMSHQVIRLRNNYQPQPPPPLSHNHTNQKQKQAHTIPCQLNSDLALCRSPGRLELALELLDVGDELVPVPLDGPGLLHQRFEIALQCVEVCLKSVRGLPLGLALLARGLQLEDLRGDGRNWATQRDQYRPRPIAEP